MYPFPSGWSNAYSRALLGFHEGIHDHPVVIKCTYRVLMPFAVFCQNCGFMVASATLEEAVKKWNKTVNPE